MISNPLWQWVFTLIFGPLTAYYLYRMLVSAVKDRRQLEAVSFLLHTLMSIGMLAMVWPWWDVVPAKAQLTVFALASLWYLIIVVLSAMRKVDEISLGGHGTVHQIGHAVMMLSMTWMLLSMSGGSGTESHGEEGHDHSAHDHAAHDHSAHDHAAHDHSGHTALDPSGHGSGHGSHSLMHEPFVFVSGIVITALLVIASIWFLLQFFRGVKGHAPEHRYPLYRPDMISNSLMGFAMAFMNLLMYWPSALG